MKLLRNPAILLAVGVLLFACSREEELQPSANPLLTLVPADTPYVFANLQAIPDDIMDAWLLRAEPFLAELQATLSDARQDLVAGPCAWPSAR